MNYSHLALVIAVLCTLSGVLLSACSGDEPSQAQSQPAQTNTQTNAQTQTQAAATQPSGTPLPKNGKVVKVMHAGGYTYMRVEKDGKEFWVAATMLNVKREDYVHWADAAVMKNFSSSTLHKTFDEILFVTNAELDQ